MNKKVPKTDIKDIIRKIVNPETIAYVIAGGLTTVVNFCSYMLLYCFGMEELTANAIAWVISVTFAYIVNKINVFKSTSTGFSEELVKVLKFYGARLVTLGIEQVGMYYFIYRLGIYHLFVKIGLGVFVVTINYVLSKLWIFYKKKE